MNLKKAVKNTCCWRFINTRPGKYVKFYILFLFDILNLLVDWYFYLKVELIKPGLVYGPPELLIRQIIFGFCCISILSFIIETIQSTDDLFKTKKISFLTQSLSNFLVIVFEDIPLLSLNLIITLCRDGEPTIISVVKASIVIFAVIIRFILIVLFNWFMDSEKTRCNIILDMLSTIGIFIMAILSVSIHLLNNFPTSANGAIQIPNPVYYNHMSYATDKYLKNVGIYSQWPIDNAANGSSYIWLTEITDVIEVTNLKIKIRSDFAANNKNYSLCIEKFNKKVCFKSENSDLKILDEERNILKSDLFDVYEMEIVKEPPQGSKYKLGYISLSVNKIESGQNGTSKCSTMYPKSIIYAKDTDYSDSDEKSYLKQIENKFRFYSKEDLIMVNKLWLTGIFKCRMSGDLGPKLNKNINLNC
ncbi:hypothetical protein BpHYR1_012422 [Brachionus plicatilis]|uniref:Uncharacterized protein n=1 Tax=Brachionus plicatilis TaxID=10195 RepID=A0A3M7SNF4_BRAPC|nr:hypothetical protein BpHYR1_012422 [Brachionus plicatilis]